MDFKNSESFTSVIDNGLETERWFTEEHDHNKGATSKKLPFLSVEQNRKLFNLTDAHEYQENDNILVNVNSSVATEMATDFVIFDTS